jgi:hypothetical protein
MTREENFWALTPKEFADYISLPSVEQCGFAQYALVTYYKGAWSDSFNDNDVDNLKQIATSTFWMDDSKIYDLDTNEIVFENKAK